MRTTKVLILWSSLAQRQSLGFYQEMQVKFLREDANVGSNPTESTTSPLIVEQVEEGNPLANLPRERRRKIRDTCNERVPTT